MQGVHNSAGEARLQRARAADLQVRGSAGVIGVNS